MMLSNLFDEFAVAPKNEWKVMRAILDTNIFSRSIHCTLSASNERWNLLGFGCLLFHKPSKGLNSSLA